ncbi:MAG TPA: hypothetical protein ENI08_02935 [Candidatus Dependentiae bacterium]|nr:hypothetical protein [Candidatus Dependentiae bacterium]
MNLDFEYPTKEQLKRCKELVLCKSELFFQTKTGDTLLSWYPVGIEAACICSLFFEIPASIEGNRLVTPPK